MHLRKLMLLGFKSFAEKTVLNFDAGITCIVGPNGCGKSNIADAFRWVLGEQSAKSMRGIKMPDVIFAGTIHRQPLNFAEVSLTLTDVQGYLPVDYEEVTITRRLHRSGESEYLLNSYPVRLKDLQTLFLGSGIGRNAFSIFEQGKLDQIINSTPIERRCIFEEAAGILRFLQRKKETLKRLEQADLNFLRVRDVFLEVEKQIQILQSQAQKARIFKEKKQELDLLEKGNHALRWKISERTFLNLKIEHQKCHESLKDHQYQENLSHIQYREAQHLYQQHEKNLRNQNDHLVTLRNQQEIRAHAIQSLQQHLKEVQTRSRKLKQELEDFVLARKNRRKILNEIGLKRQQLEIEWKDAETQWISQQERVRTQEKEIVNLRQALKAQQQAYLKSFQQESQWQSEFEQLQVRIENLDEHHKQIEIRLQQLEVEWHQLVKNGQEKKQNLQHLSALVESHKVRMLQYEEELKKTRLRRRGETNRV